MRYKQHIANQIAENDAHRIILEMEIEELQKDIQSRSKTILELQAKNHKLYKEMTGYETDLEIPK